VAPEIEKIIQQSMDTIEENLRAAITLQELSEEAGFSLSHYDRLFKAATGMSAMRYVARRRLLHAAYAMSRGQRAIDAALEYGFDTHAGFYRAFRREFGCAPSRYLRAHRAARPVRVNLKEEGKRMDQKDIRRALKAWGLEKATLSPIYYANTGNRSDNALDVDGRLIVRAENRLGALLRQAALQKALMKQGLAAEIVPALDGREVVPCADGEIMLSRRLEGAPVGAMRLMEKPEEARAVGEGIARMHAALRECDPILCQDEDLLLTLRDWAIPAACRVMPIKAQCDAVLLRMEKLLPLLPRQIVHRDPNPDNILMRDGRVVGFVDFDLSRILPRIFDICYAATGVLCDLFTQLDAEKRLAFFEVVREIGLGYDAHTPLTREEWEALPDMVIAIELICVAAFAGTEKYAQLAQVNQEMLCMVLKNEARMRISQ
jgi:Ser/Thr protein kinase RdoA (MazF antagonist)/AraC-like DNA-binding protein